MQIDVNYEPEGIEAFDIGVESFDYGFIQARTQKEILERLAGVNPAEVPEPIYQQIIKSSVAAAIDAWVAQMPFKITLRRSDVSNVSVQLVPQPNSDTPPAVSVGYTTHYDPKAKDGD